MDRVVKTYTRRSGKSDLLCCRACLATEGKLVNMLEHKLASEFFRISGITVRGTVKLPHYLCVWCAAIIRRCATFRAKCLQANEHLLQLTTNAIGAIDRKAYKLVDLSLTAIEIVSFDGSDMSDVLDPIRTDNLIDLQDDTNKPDVNNDLYMQIESLNKNETEIYIVEIKNENVEVEYYDENIDESISEIKSEVVVDPITVHIEEEVNIIKTEKIDAEKIKNDKGIEVDIVDVEEKKGLLIEKWRSAQDGFKPRVNLDKFKDACDVDIVILTLEEQQAEIEARRASYEYKTAPYPCEPCGKYYRAQETFNSHNARHSENAGPFECPVCKQRFKLNSKRWLHYNMHRFKYVCRQCGFVSRNRGHAKQHHEYHAGKQYKCSYCDKVFSKHSSYFGHVRIAHQTMFAPCGMCGETFVNVRLHMASMHGVAGKKDMECKICEVTFVSTHALEKHKMAAGENHTKMSPCVQCGENFDSEDAMNRHLNEEHPKCLDCNATFLNASAYDTHVDRKHRGIGNQIDQKRKNANARAVELGLPLPYYEPQPRIPGGESIPRNYRNPSKVVCDHCGKTFSGLFFLRSHLSKIRGEKMKYACPHCPRSYYSKTKYQTHLRVHTGEKPYKCDHCGGAFSVKENLRRHVLNVHMGICKMSECDICGRLFTTSFAVKLHVRMVHNGEQQAPRKKETKAVKSQSSFARRCHPGRPRGEKTEFACPKFACPHCPKCFYSKAQYQAHLRVHTGEKPYKCDHCGGAFSNKDNLKRHVLNVHMGICKKSACDICGRLFTTPSSVKLHVRTVHNGEPGPKRAPRKKKTKVVIESSTE